MLFALLLASFVGLSLSGTCGPVYEGCLASIEQFNTQSCKPMTNQTLATICECYYLVGRMQCLGQCSAGVGQNETVVTQKGETEPQMNATCIKAGLEPFNLPNPPLWNATNGYSMKSGGVPFRSSQNAMPALALLCLSFIFV